MTEHKWLTKENVENAPIERLPLPGCPAICWSHWSQALKRGFKADWLEMRSLIERASVADDGDDVWDDINDMLEATDE